MNTAVISYIGDEVKENFENDFLETLRKNAQYRGAIYLIYYGSDRKFIERIKRKYQVNIFYAKNKFRVSNQRNIDIARLLKKISGNITHVLCIDGGDVWFQDKIDDIFELTEEKYGFAEENCRADQMFNLGCINQIKDKKYREMFLKEAEKYLLANSGMIAGPKEKVRIITKKIGDITEKINQDFFALDQAIFNYVARTEKNYIILPSKYNYTLKSNVNSFEVKNKLLYDIKTKELISVVHNIGGSSFRAIGKRKEIGFDPPLIPKKLPGTFWAIAVFFNPAGYKNKIKNYRIFRQKAKEQGLKLLAVELAFGKKFFELKKEDAEILIQLRTKDVLWQKERLLNIGIKNLPPDCDKFAWIDADVIFLNDNWIKDTCDLLEKYAIIQPFYSIVRIPKHGLKEELESIPFGVEMDSENRKSFGMAARVCQLGRGILGGSAAFFGHVGLVWAARKEIFEEDGLFDKIVFPNVDLWMAYAFYGSRAGEEYFQYSHQFIKKSYSEWLEKIYQKVKGSVYYTDGTILHLWHGANKDRGFPFCHKILMKRYKFDPEKDIKENLDGIYVWASDKPELHNDVRKYFLMRREEGWSLKNLPLFWENFSKKIRFIFSSALFFSIAYFFIEKLDRILGILGIFLKKNFPKFYGLLIEYKKFWHRIIMFFNFSNKKKIKMILKNCWQNYESDFFPEDRRMYALEYKRVEGMSVENVRFLINELVRNFARLGTYLEVGTWRGCSLLSAALYNPTAKCIGIDDFSEFDQYKNNEKILNDNLEKFGRPENIKFYKGDYKEVVSKIFAENPELKINVYFYDGNHSYEDQLYGLKIMLPYFAQKAVIIVDDLNWERVEKANSDFIKENPEFKSLIKIKTGGDGAPDWWNGIEIIGKNI
jgi:hypothetical protein